MPILQSFRERFRDQKEEIFYGEEMHPFVAYDDHRKPAPEEQPAKASATSPAPGVLEPHEIHWWQRLRLLWSSKKFRSI